MHRWDLTPREASEIQRNLAARVVVNRPLGPIELLAATDVSCDRRLPLTLHAGVVIVDVHSLRVCERVGASAPATFPYIPGYLSFREVPVLLQALAQVQSRYDAILCDGQGVAHPRGLGLASHLGLWLEMPTIGCAKRLLWGNCEPPADVRGACAKIEAGNKRLGSAVRTRAGCHPVYVSPGHLSDVESSCDLVMRLVRKTRLPEPLRDAHAWANEWRTRSHWTDVKSSRR